MATVAETQVIAMADKVRWKPGVLVGDDEYRKRIDQCLECSSAINTQSLCLECGCNFMSKAWFTQWQCKLGNF